MCGVTESAGLVGEQRLIEAIVVEVIVVIAAEAAVGDFVNRIVNSGCRKFNSVGVYPSSAVIKAISLVRVMKTGLLQLEIHSRVLGSGHLQVVGKGEILVLPGVPNTQP